MNPTSSLALPEGLAEWGARLLHQQCWCWGADIRRPEGNLLLAYGFSRLRPPAGVAGSTHYWKDLETARIHLWGFGVVWQEPDAACYVNRYQFRPIFVPADLLQHSIWSPEPLMTNPAGSGCGRRLIAQLASICSFAAAYEQWVAASQGEGYRARILQEWEQTIVSADQFASAWRELADRLRLLADDRASKFQLPAGSL